MSLATLHADPRNRGNLKTNVSTPDDTLMKASLQIQGNQSDG